MDGWMDIFLAGLCREFWRLCVWFVVYDEEDGWGGIQGDTQAERYQAGQRGIFLVDVVHPFMNARTIPSKPISAKDLCQNLKALNLW